MYYLMKIVRTLMENCHTMKGKKICFDVKTFLEFRKCLDDMLP